MYADASFMRSSRLANPLNPKSGFALAVGEADDFASFDGPIDAIQHGAFEAHIDGGNGLRKDTAVGVGTENPDG